MKIVFAFLATLLVLVSAATAAPTCSPSATLDTYLASNFSCSLDNLLFSNFGYTPNAIPTGVNIPANGITVTTITTTGDEGFQFSSGWAVRTQSDGSSSFQDSLITFTVSTVDHSASLTDLSLSFNGDFTGTGSTGVNEHYCPGGPVNGCPGGSGVRQVTNPPPVLEDQVTFTSPVSTLGISKDINVTSGTAGTARISQVVNQFSNGAVPEPGTYMLLGGGLLGLGLMRKKSKRS